MKKLFLHLLRPFFVGIFVSLLKSKYHKCLNISDELALLNYYIAIFIANLTFQ